MGKKRPDDRLFYGMTLTEEQEAVYVALFDENIRIVWIDAMAGTGKTTLAVGVGKILVHGEKYGHVEYMFATPYESKMGYRPGSTEEKERIYLGPLFDAIDAIGEDQGRSIFEMADESRKAGKTPWISAHSINYLRGRNLRDAFVIIDEAQNMTEKELRMVLTRIHDD